MADWNYYAAFYQTIGSPKYDLKTKGVGATVEELILWITGLKEFKATRKKADDAGMTDAQIDNAIAKLCTISLATTREGINAKLATYSNANVKSFLADILQNPCNTYNLNFGTSTGQTVNYPAGMEDYYVGLKSSNSFPTLKYEITITNTVEQPVSFTAGKIRFQQDYKIKSIPSKPSEDRTETYDETLHPFEPMKIIVANDYATLGLTKGTEVVLPSYMVMLLKNNIRRYNNQMVTRNISNALVMIGGIAAIPATAGGSIVAATSVIAASVSAVDIGVSVYRSNITVAEYNANKEYYDAWDGFYHTTTLANAVVSLPGTINTLRSVNIADKWQKLINIRKNSLKWNTLSSNGKALFQTLITEIGNRLGVVLTVGGIAFIQKTLSISTASAQEIAFLGAIAFVREIPLLAPISNTLTKTLLKTSSNAFKTDING